MYCTYMYPIFIHPQRTVSKHQNLSNRSLGPMTSWIVIIQIFILLSEAARPRIFQPGQGISFLTLQDQFGQARESSNTHLYSTTSQNNTLSEHLPVSPIQSTNLTHNSSVGNLEAKLTCHTYPLNYPESCRQALSLLPRDGGEVSFGRFDQRDYVTRVLPYSVTSC